MRSASVSKKGVFDRYSPPILNSIRIEIVKIVQSLMMIAVDRLFVVGVVTLKICCVPTRTYTRTCAHIFLNAAINSVACHTSIFRATLSHQGKFMLCKSNVSNSSNAIVSHVSFNVIMNLSLL